MKAKKTPMRMCIGCREMKPKRELVRIVRCSDGTVKLDATGKLNGRGAYVCRNVECLKKIRRQNALAHTFSVPVDGEIYDSIEAEFEKIEG